MIGSNNKPDYRELANRFHEYGFNILPTGKGGNPKAPILPQHTGWGESTNPDKGITKALRLGSKTQSLEELMQLPFDRALGIAGVVGCNHICTIDFDPKNGKQVEEPVIKQALQLLGLHERYEWVVRTGKGFHIWLQIKDKPFEGKGVQKYPSLNQELFQHLELRLENCYTILPFSQHTSGNVYRFHNVEDFPVFLPVYVEAAKVEEMVKQLCKWKEPEQVRKQEPIPFASTQSSSYDYGNNALDTAIRMVEDSQDGDKHNTLNKAAFLCGGYVGGGLLGHQEALDSLSAAIRGKPNVKDKKKADKTIEDGLKDGAKKPFNLEELERARKEFLSTLTNKKLSSFPSNIIKLSDTQFAKGIWLFETISKNKEGNKKFIVFKGLYRDGIIKFLSSKGYYKRYREDQSYVFIKEHRNIIEEVEVSLMRDFITDYVDRIKYPLKVEYEGLHLSVLPAKLKEILLRQDHLIFNENFLGHFPNHTKQILKDDRETCHIPYTNTIVQLTEEGRNLLTYEDLKETCIWKSQIIARNFHYVEANSDSHFARFLKNISSDKGRFDAFQSAIGYLIHNFNHPSKGQAIICYDEQITDLSNPQGGTGKGLFANALKQIRSTVKVDGKKFNANDKFCFQEVKESTQVVWFDDVKPDMGFDRFNSILTDGWNIEKKYKDSFFIDPKDSPKVLICSNSILENEGSTRKRRQFILEFGNHYSRQIKRGTEEPIIKEHGCTFFDNEDWDSIEWNAFDSFMLDCVAIYLNNGLIPYIHRNIEENRIRQTLGEDFYSWVQEKTFKPDYEYNTKEQFREYKGLFHPEDDKFKQRSFTNLLKRYASIRSWLLSCNANHGVTFFKFQSGN